MLAMSTNLELSKGEIKLLVQSLDHCLATCHNDTKKGPCKDCEAAKALRDKLAVQR
jgi:hypothetical protein